MAKPTPKPFDPSEVTDLAHATIKDAKFPQLAAVKVIPNRVSYMQEWALTYHDVPLD